MPTKWMAATETEAGPVLWLSLTMAPLLGDNNGMGSRVFDFLTESLLFRDDLIRDRFASVPLPEIERELDRYRDFCIANQAAFMDEVDRTSTVAFYDPEPIDVRTARSFIEAH